MDKNFLDTLSKDGDAYLIRSAEDLCNLSEYVNAGNDCKEKFFKLANDIDLSDVENFTPIGTQEINPFAGTFDGDRKTIVNLKIVGENYVGLFGCNAGNINNVNLSDVEIKACNFIGGLVGYNDGAIEKCSASSNVSGNNFVGGLVGWHKLGTIQSCTVVAKVDGSGIVGGLVGGNSQGLIVSCAASGSVNGTNSIGGLVGNSYGTIKNCSASGNVSGGTGIGGLVGSNRDDYSKKFLFNVSGTKMIEGLSIIENCTANSSVSGKYDIGGLVGYNGGLIEKCLVRGKINGGASLGGLIGVNSGTVKNCSASASVSGESNVDALVGYNGGLIMYCKASGTVDIKEIDYSMIDYFVGFNSDAVNKRDEII